MQLQPVYRLIASALILTTTVGFLPQASIASGGIGVEHPASLVTYRPSSLTTVQGVRPRADQRDTHVDGTMHRATTGGTPSQCGCGPGSGNTSSNPLLCWHGARPIGPAIQPSHFQSHILVEGEVSGMSTFQSINLFNGVANIAQLDASLPQPSGALWFVGHDYNPRQLDDSDDPMVSSGYMGNNFFNTGQPELVFYNGSSDDEDMIYMVIGASRYLTFKRADDDPAANFVGLHGAWGVFTHSPPAGDEPGIYTLTDLNGNTMDFFGFDANAEPATGQLWRLTDPDGNTSYVGDETVGSDAIAAGFDASGRVLVAYDAHNRRFSYTYSSGLLTHVVIEVQDGEDWDDPENEETVLEVQYAYYGDSDDNGSENDLKLVTITLLPGKPDQMVRKTFYAYWKGTYVEVTNPGQAHDVKMILTSEGLRRSGLGDGALADAAENTLKPYASAYFKYDEDHRVIETWSNASCGCSGSAAGAYQVAYETNTSFTDDPDDYDTDWFSRTIVTFPDKGDENDPVQQRLIQYFDETGQPLSRVITDGDPEEDDPAPNLWATVVKRNASGMVTEVATPANVTAYDHADGTFTQSETVGLITVYDRVSAGDLAGMLEHAKYKQGTTGTAYLSSSTFYDTATKDLGDGDLIRPLVVGRTTYTQATTTEDAGPGNSPPSGAYRTEFAHSFHGDITVKEVVTTHPAVSAAKNGSDTATVTKQYFRENGTPAFSKSADGKIGFTLYTDSVLTAVVQDADTDQGDFLMSVPTGYAADDPEAAFHFKRENEANRVGQTKVSGTKKFKSLLYEHATRTFVTTLADGRAMEFQYARFESGTPNKYYGPVQFTVRNHAGQVEAQGTIALNSVVNAGDYTEIDEVDHIDVTKSDPLLAIQHSLDPDAIGTVSRYSTNIYDSTGNQVLESRVYFSIPTSGAGTEGTHYDATRYGYDNLGHRWRVKSPDGTIRRTKYDAIGRMASQWIGTNDNHSGFPGGENAGTSNMVKIEELEYDSGLHKANSLVTKRTAFIQDDTTGKRETTYLYDFRGRQIVQINPTAPHVLNMFDNAGRSVASAMYSSSSGLDASDDPTALPTNRLTLNQTFYDEMGRVWKTQRHKIDPADGSDDDDLQTLTWYDAAGRVIKVKGGQLTKTTYDRLGRAIHQFVLADTNDSSYGDAGNVTGDHVLVQSDTVYDINSGLVIMTATIDRFFDDGSGGTSGALDSNEDESIFVYSDDDLAGRIQITANWHDHLDRVIDTVAFGTNGGDDYDRFDELWEDAAPARSSTRLRTTYVFGHDGTMQSMIDPKGIETRYVYDALGRQVAVINNYDDGVPTGPTGVDDVITRYAYTAGHKTKMHVDLDGNGDEDSNDQVTTWHYGVVKGTSAGESKIASGSLLQKVVYPPQYISPSEQPAADRSVLYAYNAQGQMIWQSEHTLNVMEYVYDSAGRQTHKLLSTLAGSFDGAVKRISTTYDAQGRRQLVTQWDDHDPLEGEIIDQVKFTYDGWGNLEMYQQDNNSAVVAEGDDYYVRYEYEKTSNAGRNTLRRTLQAVKNGEGEQLVDYVYRNNQGRFDVVASRVTDLELNEVQIVSYKYNGSGTVVETTYGEPGLSYARAGGFGVYPALDRFNRVISDKWQRGSVVFHDYDITYDENSNIVLTEDNVFTPSISPGFDAQYTMDNLNRLTKDEQGSWSGTAITSRSRQQIWTLDQVGNWDNNRVDRDGNNDFFDTGDIDEERTHNSVNELLVRDVDGDGDTDYDDASYELSYNLRGDMTDDGQNYEYVYDGFGRLRRVLNHDVPANVIAEYWYNGLGHRISWRYDTNVDGEADGDDVTFHFAYDERWRMVATYRADDEFPKEQFYYHCAGNDGYGGSSYIDAVILRDQETSEDWLDAADHSMERRDYYCQNWRSDVVAMVSESGIMRGWVRYSAYGVPYGIPAGDTNGDGVADTADFDNIDSTWAGNGNGSTYPTGDLNLDGDIDADDTLLMLGNWALTLGWEALSQGLTHFTDAAGNRKGYAGYEFDPILSGSLWHVRHRVLHSELGRWTRRDPLGYVDGAHMLAYVQLNAMSAVDPSGLSCGQCECVPGRRGSRTQATDASDPVCAVKCQQAELGHNGGLTICFNGGLYECICTRNISESFRSPRSRSIVKDCLITHEALHGDDWDCEPICWGPTGKECGRKSCNECGARSGELLCLILKCGASGSLTGQCDACYGDKQCQAEIRRHIRWVLTKLGESCTECSRPGPELEPPVVIP